MTTVATDNRTESRKRHLYGSGQEPVQQAQDSRRRVGAPRVALGKEAVGSENCSCLLDMSEGSPSLLSIPSQERSTASAAGMGWEEQDVLCSTLSLWRSVADVL